MYRVILIAVVVSIAVASILLLPDLLYGQTPPPPPGKPDQNPIDGGLGLLAAAGGAYAIKKLRDKSKE